MLPRYLGLIGIILLSAPTAQADPKDARDAARKEFDLGLAALKAAQFAEACPRFEASFALEPLPGTLFTWAECLFRAEQGVLSHSLFQRYLRLYEALPPELSSSQESRATAARERLQTLESQGLALLRVTLRGAPLTLTELAAMGPWQLDEQPLETAALTSSIALAPGPHHLESGSGPTKRYAILAQDHRTLIVELSAQEEANAKAQDTQPASPEKSPEHEKPEVRPAAASAPLPGSSRSESPWLYVSIGTLSLGVAGAVSATAVLLGKKDALDRDCPDGACARRSAFESSNDISTWDTIGTISTGAAVLGALGVGYFWLLRPDSSTPSSSTARLSPVVSQKFIGLHCDGQF